MQLRTPTNLSLIALSYFALVVLVYPMGDFPVNDDWAYARSVLTLVESGEFHLLDWGAMTLITQVVWGALWVKFFGFSFEVLRLSTIVLGFVALAGCHFLILGQSKKAWIALTGTLVLMTNPMFLVLTSSFMTDVPFLALSVWSSYFLMRAIDEDSVQLLLPGMCFAIAAILLRQIALVLPLAFLFGYATRFYQSISIRRLLVCIGPFSVGLITYIAYIKWLKVNDNLPYAMIWSQERLKTNFLGLFDGEFADLAFYLGSAGSMLLYLGLFSVPMMLALYLRYGPSPYPGLKSTRFWVAVGALLGVITTTLLVNEVSMPVRGNLLTTYGIGPFTLRDVYALNLPHLDAIPRGTLQFITGLSVLGALLLAHGLFMLARDAFLNRTQGPTDPAVTHWRVVFLCILMAAYLLPLVLTDYFDRYLMFLLPFLFALIAMRFDETDSTSPSLSKLLYLVPIAVFALASTTLAHDYLSWNRTRLQATNWVMDEHKLDHSSIDSGFEFNGFYGYDPRYSNDQAKWVLDDKYVISYDDVPGYVSEKRFKLERLLPIGPQEIVVSRRDD